MLGRRRGRHGERNDGCCTRSESADETATRALKLSWAKAYNPGDAKGGAALYAEDAVILLPAAPSASGHAHVGRYPTWDRRPLQRPADAGSQHPLQSQSQIAKGVPGAARGDSDSLGFAWDSGKRSRWHAVCP
jgi:hypothetical protein